MISIDPTPGPQQIVLSSEVFQMAEYNYTKPSELLEHNYACSPYEESSIITIHKGSEDEDKENGQKMVKNAKLSKKRKIEALENSQENEIVPDFKKPKLTTSLLKSPRLTIASLCTIAFKYFPSGVGTVDDIYQFFGFIFPYYQNDPKGNWKNSVRHHLTLKRPLFIKSDEMGKKSGTKAAHYWLMNPAYAEMSNKKLLEDFKQKKKHVLADTNVPDYLENLVNRPMDVAQLIPVIDDQVPSVGALEPAELPVNSTTVAQEFQISSTTQLSGTYFIFKMIKIFYR